MSTDPWKKSEIPSLWDPNKAMKFFDLVKLIDKYLQSGMEVKRHHLLVVFFHETEFSNIRQNRGQDVAVGFGQMQIFDTDKIPFFATIGYNSANNNPHLSYKEEQQKTKELDKLSTGLKPLSYEAVLGSNEFAVEIHCKYYNWLVNERKKGLRGILEAQTGSGVNKPLIDTFIKSGNALDAAMISRDRQKIINALNSARLFYNKDSKNPSHFDPQSVKIQDFPRYWDFTLPASDLSGNPNQSAISANTDKKLDNDTKSVKVNVIPDSKKK